VQSLTSKTGRHAVNAAPIEGALHQPESSRHSPQELESLQQRLGYRFTRVELLQQACTHSDDRSCLSYKQLAFVGDAALWCMFAQYAFHTFPDEDPRR
jgi:dsRNA-specific ribonuclease